MPTQSHIWRTIDTHKIIGSGAGQEAATEAIAGWTQHMLRNTDTLWRMEGREHPILVGIDLSTDQLTAARVELLPGQHSDPRVHSGDAAGYVLEGRLNLCLLDESGDSRANRWFEADERDGFFVPSDGRYQFFNMTDRPVRPFLGVASTISAERKLSSEQPEVKPQDGALGRTANLSA